MKKNKVPYRKRKRIRYLNFMQTVTDVGMYALSAWFVCLLFSIIAPNFQAIKYAFVIISGLWVSSFVFWVKNKLSEISVVLIKSPKYILTGQESEIEIKVEIKKGSKKDWKLRMVTSNHPNEKDDYFYYLWLYSPTMKKWKDRWAIQNNVGYYEEELSPIAMSDETINGNENVKVKLFGRKRGLGIINQVKLGRTDPLGWLQANKIIDIASKNIFVIPVPKKITSWPSKRAKNILLHQKIKTQRKMTQNGEEWIGLREARYNDPMKNTHWKSLAKTGKRWIIEKEEKFQSKLSLVIDPVLGNEDDKEIFEILLETLSGQVMNTGKTSEIDWIFIDSDPIGSNGNAYNAWDKVMEKIALMKPVSEKEIDDAWIKYIPRWKNVAALRIITTRNEAQLEKWISKWRELNIDVEIFNVKDNK